MQVTACYIKACAQGISIVFHISLSINLNSFSQNVLEVSFSVVNIYFRSVGCVSRNACNSPHSDAGVVFSIFCYTFCVSQIVFIHLFFKKTQQKMSDILYLEVQLETVSFKNSVTVTLKKFLQVIDWSSDSMTQMATLSNPRELSAKGCLGLVHGQRCCDQPSRC